MSRRRARAASAAARALARWALRYAEGEADAETVEDAIRCWRDAEERRHRQRGYALAWQERQREAGLCIACTEEAEPSSDYCTRHLHRTPEARARDLRHAKRTQAERKAQGLCVRCGQRRALDGHVFCEEHLIAQRIASRQQPRKGVTRCGICRQPGHNRLTCPQRDDP